MLVDLKQQGFPLYVCTSKQQHFAQRILDAFDLSALFTAIYGDKSEFASHRKADLLATLLAERSLDSDSNSSGSPGTASPCPASPFMIGDRTFDFDAARENRIRSLAAGWGYGSPEECAQASAVAPTPADVAALVSPR
jgi:phosphoglycolate phosphatase